MLLVGWLAGWSVGWLAGWDAVPRGRRGHLIKQTSRWHASMGVAGNGREFSLKPCTNTEKLCCENKYRCQMPSTVPTTGSTAPGVRMSRAGICLRGGDSLFPAIQTDGIR